MQLESGQKFVEQVFLYRIFKNFLLFSLHFLTRSIRQSIHRTLPTPTKKYKSNLPAKSLLNKTCLHYKMSYCIFDIFVNNTFLNVEQIKLAAILSNPCNHLRIILIPKHFYLLFCL
jgi:hypothetical protein